MRGPGFVQSWIVDINLLASCRVSLLRLAALLETEVDLGRPIYQDPINWDPIDQDATNQATGLARPVCR